MLVVSIENEKKECISWHTSDFKDFLHMRIDGKVYLSLRMADIADLPAKILPPNSSFVQRLYPRMAAGSLLFVSQLPAISDLHLAAPSA